MRSDRYRVKVNLLSPWVDDIVRHPKIMQYVNEVLGPDVLMWTADFFCKEPGTPHFVSWHQDGYYWGMEDNDSMVSVWLAMSPVTVENGCMRMVPGVHKEAGFREHAEGELAVADAGGKLEDNMSSKGQCIVRAAELEAQAEHVPLKPGDLAIFHLKTPHASAANVADYPRIGLAMRYMRTDYKKMNAAVDGNARDTATLVSGKDEYKLWDEEFVPTSELSPEAVAAHEKAMGGAGGGGHKRRIVPAGR